MALETKDSKSWLCIYAKKYISTFHVIDSLSLSFYDREIRLKLILWPTYPSKYGECPPLSS